MATRPSVSDYMRTLRATVPILVSQIKELAIAEMKPSAIHGGIGAGLFGGAGVIGLIVLKFFLFAAAFGMSFAYYRGGFQHISALALGFLTVQSS